jgi:nicotinate-nucleotide pyrophosphorylase (carboxylating)
VVRRALEEDRAFEDLTTQATVADNAMGDARLVAKQDCVVAGLEVFEVTFHEMDPTLTVKGVLRDGDRARAGSTVARVSGHLRPILSAERTSLNFVQRLSGIATLTRAYVDEAFRARPNEDPPLIQIRDTRKTTPLLRDLEKEAVRSGGGTNHRRDLASAILIKDNHIAAAGGVTGAINSVADRQNPDLRMRWMEVECDTLEQVQEALDAGADEILLDNMDLETLRKAAALVREHGRRSEASGGVTLETVGAIAETGVDSISVGALTHSAPAIDLSLEVEAI